MSDTLSFATIALTSLTCVIVLAVAGLQAWHEWIELQRHALFGGPREPHGQIQISPPGARIELADLRERVRKLEAIAAGVDL